MLDTVGPYDLRFRLAADYDLNIRCYGARAATRYVPEIVAFYAGTGMSASTDDTVFLEQKYRLLARHDGCSLFDPVFADCRWDFRRRAADHLARSQWGQAARYAVLFAAHAVAAKFAR